MRSAARILLLFGVAFLLTGAAPRAHALCRQCSSTFTCLSASEGARLCLAFGETCTMAGACVAGPRDPGGGLDDPLDGPVDEALTSVTVLDEAPSALGPTGVRIESARGEDLVADAAARGWSMRTGGEARPTLLAGLMHGQGIPIAVRTRTGDGFVIERRDTRRGVKLVVRSMFAGHPGHVIVSRFIEDGDLVAVRVPFEGRPRVVLFQALRLSSTRDAARIEAMQAAVAESARMRRTPGARSVDLVPVATE